MTILNLVVEMQQRFLAIFCLKPYFMLRDKTFPVAVIKIHYILNLSTQITNHCWINTIIDLPVYFHTITHARKWFTVSPQGSMLEPWRIGIRLHLHLKQHNMLGLTQKHCLYYSPELPTTNSKFNSSLLLIIHWCDENDQIIICDPNTTVLYCTRN